MCPRIAGCNVKSGGNIRRGAMGGVGECYHGTDQLFFTEFRGNRMNDSDGISLADSLNSHESPCAAYGGPWIAWSVVRDNSMGGISLAARNGSATAGHGALPCCAAVTVFGVANAVTGTSTSDVVGEHNVFECPPGGNRSTAGYNFEHCEHCVER